MKRSRKNTIQYEKSAKCIFKWFTWIIFLVLGILVYPAKAADVQVTVDAQQIAGDINKRLGCGIWNAQTPEELKKLKNMGISDITIYNVFNYVHGSWNGVQNTMDLSDLYPLLDSIIDAGCIPWLGSPSLPYWFNEDIVPSFYNLVFPLSDANGEYLEYLDRDNNVCRLYKSDAYSWPRMWPPLNDSLYGFAFEDAMYQLALGVGQYCESKGVTTPIYFEIGAEHNLEGFWMGPSSMIDYLKAAHPDPENPNWGPSPAWALAHPGRWSELSGINERIFLMYKHFQAGIARAEAELSVPIKVGGTAGALAFRGDYCAPFFVDYSWCYTDFIRFCAENNLRLDFYSIHQYGISATKTAYGTYSESSARLAQITAQVANEYPNYQPIQGNNLEIINSEFGSCWESDPNNVQGSNPAAWLFEYLSSGLGRGIYVSNRDSGNGVDWEGLDFGLKTDSGMNKALSSAIRIHNRLMGDKLLWSKADSLLGRVGVKASKYSDDPQRMSLVLWNYIFRGNVVDANGNIVTGPANPAQTYHYTNPDQSVAITVTNLPGWPRVQCRRYLIDKTHSNPLYFKDVAPQNHQYLEEMWPIRTFTCGDGYLSPDGKTLTLPDELLKGSSDETLQGSVLYSVLANDIPREVVKNPGFEYSLNDWLIPYYVDAICDSSVKFEGTNSLKVSCSYGGGYVSQEFKVKPGRTYTASLCYKSDGTGHACARIVFGPEEEAGGHWFTWNGAQTEWTRSALSFVVPEEGFEPGYPRIDLASYYPGSGFVWYDDIVVEQEGVYIANGSFERDAIVRGMPDKWPAAYYIEAGIDQTAYVTGTRSLKMSCRQGGGFISQQLFNLKPDTAYRGILWHKSDGAGLADARIVFGPEDETAGHWLVYQGAQTEWTREELSFVVPEDGFEPGYPRIDLASHYPGSGFVWYDGIEVEENGNYVANGSFERDLDLDGRPDSWYVPSYVNALIVEKTELGQYNYKPVEEPLPVSTSTVPIASAGADVATGYMPLTVHFTGSGTDDAAIVGYHWDFGDGGSSTAQNPTHTYTGVGSFVVVLTVIDNTGETDTASLIITTVDPTIPVASASADVATGYMPLTVNFTGSGTDDGVIVGCHWDFGDGGSSTEQSPTHTYAGAGSFVVVLTVTDNTGKTDTASLIITTVDPTNPIALASADVATGYMPLTVHFTGSGADDGVIVGYHWDFGDGGSSSEQNPTHTYTDAGSFVVLLTVTDNTGKTDTTSLPPITAIDVMTEGAPIFYEALSGYQSLRLSCEIGGGWVSQVISVKPNKEYTAFLSYKTDGIGLACARIVFGNVESPSDPQGYRWFVYQGTSIIWDNAKIDFTVPDGGYAPGYPRIELASYYPGSGFVWYDDVGVVEKEEQIINNGTFGKDMETWTPSMFSSSRIVADSGPDGSQSLAVSKYEVSQQLSLATNTDYVIDFWYRTEPGAKADVRIHYVPGLDASWKWTWILHNKESSEWTRVTIPFHTASEYGGNNYPRLIMGYDDWGNASTYFDDVQVYLAEAPVVRNGDYAKDMETWTPSLFSSSRIVADSGPDGSQSLAVSRYEVSQQLGLAPDTDYVIDFWYRTEPGAKADVRIHYVPGLDASGDWTWILNNNETPEWTRATIPFHTASEYGGSDYPRLIMGYDDWGNASTYFDDVQVYLAEAPVVRNGDYAKDMETWTPSLFSSSRIVADSGPDGSQSLAVSRYEVSQQLSLAPDTDYVIDFWYRTEPGATAEARIHYWPGLDASGDWTWILYHNESAEWTHVTIPFHTASEYGGSDYPRLILGYEDNGNASTYFDNVQVYLAQ